MQTNNLSSLDEFSDEMLAARVARGDPAALELLYDRYAAKVLGIAMKILDDRPGAEEVLQETFWRAWKRAEQYQPERGAFAGWLFRIARNLAFDQRRAAVRVQVIPEPEAAESFLERLPDPGMDTSKQAENKLNMEHVHNAMQSVPPEQRQVLELAYFHGLTRQEIAAATGLPPGTVHTRARLGLQKLRRELENVFDLQP